MWVDCECYTHTHTHKIIISPSLKGWGQHLWGVLRVLKEKPHRGEVDPMEAFLQSHKDRLWAELGHGR